MIFRQLFLNGPSENKLLKQINNQAEKNSDGLIANSAK
ncbi:hypothetical protein l11_02630 [Neisseria weaveri LMG 5135]|nr:hypothetical protein l13_10400 [Neisseria weaveri ATCC 51223]EGV38816.1 hypothetical protein l11_02630 [Neisseria weaveri LMG 5135]